MNIKQLFVIFLQFLCISISINLHAKNKLQNLENKYKLGEYIDITNKNSIKSYILNNININKSFLSKSKILSIINMNLGDKIYINNAKYNSIINNLWKTGLFEEKIKIKFSKINNNKVDLYIYLKDLPTIYSLDIFGIKKDIFNKIAKNYNVKLGGVCNQKTLNKIKEDLIKYYNENGYPNVDVTYSIKKLLKNNISLYFNVDKKNKVEINKIIFEGNKNIPNINFDENIIDNTPFFFKKNKYYRNIIDKYHTLGFRDFRILSSIFNRVGDLNTLNIKMHEGNPFFIGKINLFGNKVFNNDFLYKIINFSPKNPYDLKNFYKKILDDNHDNSIISNYIDKGYINSTITTKESSIEKNKVNLDVKVFEGKQSIINNVDYSGNKYTKNNIVSKYLDTYIGDVFSRKNIRNTIFSLGKLDFFDPKKISVEIKPYKNRLDLNYKIFEKNSNKIQLQGGYGNNKFTGNLSVKFNNLSTRNIFNIDKWNPLPQGDGEKLSIFYQTGSNTKSYGFSFINPYLFNDKLTSLNLGSTYSINKNIINENDEENDNSNTKSNLITSNTYLGIDKKIPWKNNNFVLTAYSNYNRYNRTNTNMGYFELPKDGISNDISYNIGLKYNSLNNDTIYPLNGLDFDIKSMFTIPYSYIFKDKDKYTWPEYFKIKNRLYIYNELLKNFVIKTGGEFGLVGYYNSNYGASPFQKFYLGGTANAIDFQGREFIPLRGYSDFSTLKSVTPQEGGEIYSRILTEIRYPIFKNSNFRSWVLGFFEAGGTLSDFKMMNNFIIKQSIGTGIRLSVNKLGILGLDLGYGFQNTESNDESKFRTHFIIGNEI